MRTDKKEKGGKISLSAKIYATVIASFVAFLALCGFYLHFQNTALQVKNYEIKSDKLSEESGFKIAHVTDFHNTKSKKLTDRLVKEIEKSSPDMIVLTGDLIDSYRTDIDVAVAFVNRIVGIAPVFSVSGNHEGRIAEYPLLLSRLEDSGVTVLENRVETAEIRGFGINVTGVADPRTAHASSVDDSVILESELNGLRFDGEIFTVLLSHRPEAFELFAQKDIDLVLSGHTHGGQIRLPFIGALYAPNQGFFPKYASGLFEKNGTSMIISRGVGNSSIPVRINDRPELVVVSVRGTAD